MQWLVGVLVIRYKKCDLSVVVSCMFMSLASRSSNEARVILGKTQSSPFVVQEFQALLHI